MLLNTKEAICTYVNSRVSAPKHLGSNLWKVPFLGAFFPYFFNIPRVHVPIYTSPWKIKIIKALQRKFYAWRYGYTLEEIEQLYWEYKFDFSKIIWPDQWKSYTVDAPVALL